MKRFVIYIAILLISASVVCQASTLIVSYETPHAYRLDRIHFLLTDSKQKQEIYPKGKGYVEDLSASMRMVVIENLNPGEYTIEFLIPNRDNYFEEVPARQFYLGPDAVIKIDQMIKASTF